MSVDNQTIFETLFRSASEGIMVVDAQGKIVMVNPAAQEMFGYTNSMEGMLIEELLPDHLSAVHKKHRAQYHKDPQTRAMGGGLDLMGKKKNGDTFPVEVSLSPSKVGDTSVVMAFIVDITERRNREKVVLSMGRVFDDSLNEIYIFDSETLKFNRVNEAAANNLGYTREELMEMTPMDLKPLLPEKEFKNLISPLRDAVPKLHFETIHKRKDGTTYPVEVHLQMTEFNSHESFLAIIMDISERKKAEDQLRRYSQELEKAVEQRTRALGESQKLYQTIARNFPDGMINVFDKELKYVFVEGKELYSLGIDSRMLIGTRYVDRLAPEIAAQTESELMAVFSGEPRTINIQFKENDYILEAVPLSDDKGVINQILVIEKNITEQKRIQDKIRYNLERERQLNELKSRFVSMASHEFRTPLSTILTSASLLSRYTEKEQQDRREKHINRIKTSVHNLTGILNDFLSLDKLETGAVESNPVQFDIKEFTQEVCDQVIPTLKPHQKLVYHHEGQSQVFLDKQLLNNILINLLSNASKYSDESQDIEVHTCYQDQYVSIKVKDHGIGISKQDQAHLFERFFRAHNAMNIQGTGLGLNIVQKYVELMEGEIDFESEIGVGSTFTIKIKQNHRS